MIYKPRYFTAEELLCPELLKLLPASAALGVIPNPILQDLDALRVAHGQPIQINGGGLHYCGVRPLDCAFGSSQSRHKLVVPGVVAFDLHSKRLDLLWDLINANHRTFGICRVEDRASTPTWIHAEFTTDLTIGELDIFKP